jgi:hypothetical protein
MCDYSLLHVASRPAKVGDRLVSTGFPNSITRGFAEVGEPKVAVCLLPGTELTFENGIEAEPRWLLARARKFETTVAVFRQIEIDRQNVHHDALEFPDGKVVLLNDLREGQIATVLQLPAVPHPARVEIRETPVLARSE